jgi:hypothetical protein
MAKGDVVQQDKSFMGMPVSHFPLLPASWPVSAAIEPAIGKQPSQCHQSCLPSGARMLRDGLAVTGDALADCQLRRTLLHQLTQHVLTMMTGLFGRLLEYVSPITQR